MSVDRRRWLDQAKRIVVKVGSNVLTRDNGLNIDAIRSISREVCTLIDRKIEVILVSSGAMASGLKKIGLARRPDETPKRQAISAVGQAGLIMEYENAFDRYGIKVAQILLTSDGFSSRSRYLNARNTLNTLLDWGVIPIINENDTVTVASIQFGDNDNLAALISLLMDADVLINLSDIDGLYNSDPRVNPEARLIESVETITRELERISTGIPGALGTGGMLSKVRAARKVVRAGIPMIIANGKKEGILGLVFSGENVGTFFVPQEVRLNSRKCWIGYSLKPEGVLIIDDGARTALVKRGKSLLPSGIVGVDGHFSKGAAVEVRDRTGRDLGIGLVNYPSQDIVKIMGIKTELVQARLGDKPYDEVIHRDNLVITDECAE
jgi:glutamate 5-kinase